MNCEEKTGEVMKRVDTVDRKITEFLGNYEKYKEKSKERLAWLIKEAEEENSSESYRSWINVEISKETGLIDDIKHVWGAYMDLPVAEKETLEALCVNGVNYKAFSISSGKSISQIKRLRRKGLDDIRAAMGWTAAETENS